MVTEPDTSTVAETPEVQAASSRWRQPRVWVAVALLAFVVWMLTAGALLALAALDLTGARRVALQGRQAAGEGQLQQAQGFLEEAAAGFGSAHGKLGGVL